MFNYYLIFKNTNEMKQIKVLQTFVFVFLLGAMMSIVSSCKDDDDSVNIGYGEVTGVVTDEEGDPISGVTVTVSGMDGSVSTGINGEYSVQNVSKEKHAITFSKIGYQTTIATVVADKFNADNVAIINVSMVDASAKIIGTVIDAKNGDAPFAGVTVSITSDLTATTGDDGTFAIENLSMEDYTVSFAKEGYVTITRTISKDDFVDKVATIDVVMGGEELLRGLTFSDLENADKWYYSEYRGGGNNDANSHWDWACNYLCTMDFWGNWEEQWEGTTLRIRNDAAERANPADLEVFDSYTYGSKKITVDNRILSLRLRTHNADDAAPAHFGVQVVDLSAANPAAEKVGGDRTHGSDNYADYHFDLSEYIGKEVIIAVGIYRAETGDYWKQLVLRRIAFAQGAATDWNWIPGTEVIEDWKLTQEMVRSTMPHTKKSFTGVSTGNAGRDVSMTNGYPSVYRTWRDIAHIAHEWSFIPLKKDPEVTPSEGYLIKTRSNEPANTEVPESYYYAKFSIAPGSNQLTFRTRNFGSNYTFFKLTAIKDDGTVTFIAPTSNTAQEASAAEDGCWKFKHDAGNPGNPDSYAKFVYDLSQFNGNDVVLVFSIHNGEQNGDENKLVFYSINID